MTTTTDQAEFWTYIRDGETYDADFDTKDKASEHAQIKYNEERSDSDDFKDSTDEDIELIRYRYDDDGERVILETVADSIAYEYERSDLEEHGTWHSGGGGVL